MNFNQHSELEGRHAIFSGSQYAWINYSEEKMIETVENLSAQELGTELHDLAAKCIKHRRKQKGSDYFSQYVNDAIGFGMTPEVPLKFNDYFFGFADAIKFDERKMFLRIHDLKTGATPTHFQQLMVYTAFFCLEYHFKPRDIDVELRIYQNPTEKQPDLPRIYIPGIDEIVPIYDKAISFTNRYLGSNRVTI